MIVMKKSLILLGVFLMASVSMAETLMEKMGYSADDVLLIIHADDMGMCHSANQACMEVLEKGIVTAASVMVPCPWFPEAAKFARENPEADLGLHLTLTAEWKDYRWGPIASKSKVPGLLDDEGYLFHGVRDVYESATPEEVETEIRAQIEHALAHGMKPTHLDSHMGTLYYNQEYLEVALKVADEYDIPLMWFSPTEYMIEKAGGEERFPVEMTNQLIERGVPLIDSLPSIGDVPLEKMEDAYKELIAGLEPGVHLIILHPNKLTPESRAITGTHMRRDMEYQIFSDPAMGKFIEDQGVKLIGWKDLKKVWDERIR